MAFHFKSCGQDDGGGDQFEEMAEINIIPLVDVMLVLLIIFMVAAPLSLSGIAINLPTSTIARSTIEETRVVLTITKEGRYFLDKLEVQSHRLQDQFTSLYEHRDKKDLYIRADKQVIYGKVVDAMSSAKLAGVSKISMLTIPPEGAEKNAKN